MNIQKDWKNKSGIYLITCNKEYYVGSSVNLHERLTIHKSHLKTNKHHSAYLQRCTNKYGLAKVIINILEFCERDIPLLRQLEKEYMDILNPKFNSTTPVTYEHTAEMKQKISNTLKEMALDGRWKNPNPKFQNGRKVDIYTKEGTLVHSTLFVEDATKVLNLDNRSSINIRLRSGNYFDKKSNIVVPSEVNYLQYVQDNIITRKGMFIPTYCINSNGEILQADKNTSSNIKNLILNSKDLVYYNPVNTCYYTFIGLINIAVHLRNEMLIIAE